MVSRESKKADTAGSINHVIEEEESEKFYGEEDEHKNISFAEL